jgi:hypothetical protein
MRPRSSPQAGRRRATPAAEPLESRCLLATVTLRAPGGPIPSIILADDTAFQVARAGYLTGQVFPTGPAPGDAGFFVRPRNGDGTAGPVVGLDLAKHALTAARATNSVGWHPISLTLSDDGLSATLVADNALDNNGHGYHYQLTQVVSYRPGDDFFHVTVTLSNQGEAPLVLDAFAAADQFLADSDWGVGYFDPATGTVGSLDATGRYASLVHPDTAAGAAPTAYQQGRYNLIWAAIGAGRDLDNTVLTPVGAAPYNGDASYVDVGVALQWQGLTIDPGQSARLAYSWSFGDPPGGGAPGNGDSGGSNPGGDTGGNGGDTGSGGNGSTPGVGNPPPVLTVAGALTRSSDSGVSRSDGITNVNRPTFQGQATPGASITVVATRGGRPTTLGETVAGADGSWSIKAGAALKDGTYVITATATAPGGGASATATLLGPERPLVIDTRGPRILGLKIQPRARRIEITIRDPGAGLDRASLAKSELYRLSYVAGGATRQLALRAIGMKRDGLTLRVVLRASGRVPVGQTLVLSVLDRLRDTAGNRLDGEFRRALPTGDGKPGASFHAKVRASDVRVLSLLPIEPPKPAAKKAR